MLTYGASATSCAGALQYVPELTWILFLSILDDTEAQEAERADGGEIISSRRLVLAGVLPGRFLRDVI